MDVELSCIIKSFEFVSVYSQSGRSFLICFNVFFFSFQVSMMSDNNSGAKIKQEIDTTSCCSPAPSSVNNTQTFIYGNNNQQSNVFI